MGKANMATELKSILMHVHLQIQWPSHINISRSKSKKKILSVSCFLTFEEELLHTHTLF